jgi:hypothetical protein
MAIPVPQVNCWHETATYSKTMNVCFRVAATPLSRHDPGRDAAH